MTVPASDGYRGTKRRAEEDEEDCDNFNPLVCYIQRRSARIKLLTKVARTKCIRLHVANIRK